MQTYGPKIVGPKLTIEIWQVSQKDVPQNFKNVDFNENFTRL